MEFTIETTSKIQSEQTVTRDVAAARHYGAFGMRAPFVTPSGVETVTCCHSLIACG